MKSVECWCVYYNPRDFPGFYVVRRWVGLVPDVVPLIVTTALSQARQVIPIGTIRTGRRQNDDPTIIEVWM
jgi:hypothetical protein